MDLFWESSPTTTHQDHVIAHVLGTSVLGYFIEAETLHLLLDIGFIWSLYLDGQMVLLPHPVAVSELELPEQVKAKIRLDVDRLMTQAVTHELNKLVRCEVGSEIEAVETFQSAEKLRFVLRCSDGKIMIDSSEISRGFEISNELGQE